jgi:hypothetical protein
VEHPRKGKAGAAQPRARGAAAPLRGDDDDDDEPEARRGALVAVLLAPLLARDELAACLRDELAACLRIAAT